MVISSTERRKPVVKAQGHAHIHAVTHLGGGALLAPDSSSDARLHLSWPQAAPAVAMVGVDRMGVMGRVQEVTLVLLGGGRLVEQQLSEGLTFASAGLPELETELVVEVEWEWSMAGEVDVEELVLVPSSVHVTGRNTEHLHDLIHLVHLQMQRRARSTQSSKVNTEPPGQQVQETSLQDVFCDAHPLSELAGGSKVDNLDGGPLGVT
ncbi:hypothetical protein CRUP_021237 [Coryphaenoides rupestris]|nr:hypothetical protein CRUP_021237 [Coryphaenoides rupestris]